MTSTAVITDLHRLGTALGVPDFVQGPGGNVSIKHNDQIHVKASGTRLSQVGTPGGFVGVPQALAAAALDGDAVADQALFGHQPRPSLETYFHALGARVVAHTHPVGLLLFACGPAPLEDDLDGLVRSIPYVRPGRGIATAIREILDGPAQAIVLRSHGLVVYAADVEEAIRTSRAIDTAARQRHTIPVDFPTFLAAYDADSFVIDGGVARHLPERPVHGGYLFPDAVVCATHVVVDDATDVAGAADVLARLGRSGVAGDHTGRRTVVAKNPTQLAYASEIIAAHDWIEDVLGEDARYLDADEPAGILGLPGEQYRILLGGQR